MDDKVKECSEGALVIGKGTLGGSAFINAVKAVANSSEASYCGGLNVAFVTASHCTGAAVG